jgi:hypothetical protein
MAELPIVKQLEDGGAYEGDDRAIMLEAARLIEKLVEALEPYIRESGEALQKEESWRAEISDQLYDDEDVGDYWALGITAKDIRKGIAALALAKGEKG